MMTLRGPRSATSGVLPKVGQNSNNELLEYQKTLVAFKQSKDCSNFIAWVHDQYTKCKQARSREVRQWNYNIAMYFGNQWVQMTPSTNHLDGGKLFNTKAPSERMTINRIKPIIRTELAKMLSQKPAASVIPASSDDEDLMAAQAGEQVWESLQTRPGKFGYQRQFSKAAFWTVLTGTGFLKTYWDNDYVNLDGKILEGTEQVKGDVVYYSVQPYNIFVPDLLEQEIDDQPYVLEVTIKPVDFVNWKYSSVLQKPATPTARAAKSLLDDAYAGTRADSSVPADSVFIYEIWVMPGGSKFMPQGGYALIVGDELVDYRPTGIPYVHKEFPYSKIEHIPTSKFYASSVIEDLTPLNREYNKIRTQIGDNRRKMGSINFIGYKGSVVPERITNASGQFILARQGLPLPQQLQPAQLPGYISENMDRTLSDMEDISGQHQVSKGNVPPGVTAATAISYLQERDDSLLTHTYQSIEQATQRVARQSLLLCTQFWDAPRLVKTVGADGSFDAEMLSSANLVNGTDIRIEDGSALPQSKAAKQALVMDLMKFGWISPEDGLKMMEIGGAQKIFEQLRADERQAQRENIRMKGLTPDIIAQHADMWLADPSLAIDQNTKQQLDVPPVITVNSYDNHNVHIEVHNRFRRGQAFETLPDEIKAQFEAHVEQHKFMLGQSQMIDGSMGVDPSMDQGQMDTGTPSPSIEGTPTTEMLSQESGDLSGS